MSTPRLRLKEVRVQPVFVLDDGETLTNVVYGTDQNGNPVTDHAVMVIAANEWPTYSAERFPREIKAWQARLAAEARTQAAAVRPAPNRAQRRSAAKRKAK